MLATDDDFRLWTFQKKKPRQTKCLEIVVRSLIKMIRFWLFFLKYGLRSLRRLKNNVLHLIDQCILYMLTILVRFIN